MCRFSLTVLWNLRSGDKGGADKAGEQGEREAAGIFGPRDHANSGREAEVVSSASICQVKHVTWLVDSDDHRAPPTCGEPVLSRAEGLSRTARCAKMGLEARRWGDVIFSR